MPDYRAISHQDAWRVGADNKIQGIRSPTARPADDVLFAAWANDQGLSLVRPNGSTIIIVAGQGLWADRGTGTAGAQYFATDIGPNGTMFRWVGSRWRVLYPSVLGEIGTIVTGVTGTADQYIGTGLGPFPPGLIDVGDMLVYQFAFGKTGATDAFGSATNIRLGQNGNTSDAAVASSNISGTMIAARRAGPGYEKWIRVDSATTTRAIGSINMDPSFTGVFTNGIAPETTVGTVNVTTTPWRMGISTTMGGTNDAPQLTYQRLTLMP
jgi:hypothetical protein